MSTTISKRISVELASSYFNNRQTLPKAAVEVEYSCRTKTLKSDLEPIFRNLLMQTKRGIMFGKLQFLGCSYYSGSSDYVFIGCADLDISYNKTYFLNKNAKSKSRMYLHFFFDTSFVHMERWWFDQLCCERYST